MPTAGIGACRISRSAFRALVLGALPCFLTLAPSSDAYAQATDKAAAQALFDEGLRLMKAGQFAEACPKLEGSEHIESAVGTLLYLAECYERTRRTASAWATFREASSLARESGQLERAQIAQTRAARLEPILSYLTLTVPGDARVQGLVIRRNGTVVLPDELGVSVPTDPGKTKIDVSAPGHQSFSTIIELFEKEQKTFAIPKLAATTAPESPSTSTSAFASTPAASATAPGTSSPARSSSSGRAHSAPQASAATAAGVPAGAAPSGATRNASSGPPPGGVPPAEGNRAESKESSAARTDRALAYLFGSLGLAGAGVGTFFGLRAISKNTQASASCNSEHVCKSPDALELTRMAKDAARIADITFAASGAALAASVVLFIVAPHKNGPSLRVTPEVGMDGVGACLGGTFR